MERDLLEVVDHPLIAARYFFPRPAPVPDPFVVEVPGAALHGYRTRPARAGARTWLHFHGNGEVVADYLGDWVPAVEGFGVNVVLAEYRGYGGSSGAPTLGAMLEDAAAWADACEVADDYLVVYGRSVGAIFAVEVARRRPGIAGLVIESGVADVGERLAVRVTHRELERRPV